jgi:hypothetical protein
MSAFNSVRLGVGTTFASVAFIFIFFFRCEHGKTNDFISEKLILGMHRRIITGWVFCCTLCSGGVLVWGVGGSGLFSVLHMDYDALGAAPTIFETDFHIV